MEEEAKHCPIGVYDSGVGGLTVVRWLYKVLPQSGSSTSATRPGAYGGGPAMS